MKSTLNPCASILIIISTVVFNPGCKSPRNTYVKNTAKINKVINKALPGDTIFLEDGIYEDAQIIFTSKGSQEKPIVLCAENGGNVIFQGNSNIKIGGEFLVIKGFVFKNGYSEESPVIEFRAENNQIAFNCRVTNCVIDGFNQPDRAKQDVWVGLYGKNNRFDQNIVQNKLSAGVALAVFRDDTVSINNNHQIDHNYFGKRPRLGSNGGETIRVGTSKNSLLPSNTVIEDNYFYQCDGEVEIISIKACDNKIRRNTFIECEGSVVLRHGNNNVVESNIFMGNGKAHTGGVRVINSGQKVYNNFFYGLKGDRFRSAFAMMNGVPNSLINRYHQVNNALIGFNTFVDCDNIGFCVGKDNERTAAPVHSKFFGNLIINHKSNTSIQFYDDSKGIEFASNYILSNSIQNVPDGFSAIKSEIDETAGIPYPKKELPNLQAGDFAFVKHDISGKERGNSLTIGSLQNMQQLLDYKKTDEQVTGIYWYKTNISDSSAIKTGKTHFIKNPAENLLNTLDQCQSNDIIELTDTGTFIIENGLEIAKKVTIRSAKNLTKKPVLKYSGNKSGFSFFNLINGGSLNLEGVVIDGESPGENNPEYVILVKSPMVEHFNVNIDNCEFSNFTEANYSVLKAEKGTYADSIVIQNSIFREMSCDAISLASEKDDNGRYNTESLVFRNCAFHKIMGNAINLYRGGNDESTFGPSLLMDHCTFNEVNNREAGSVLRLIGVQKALIKNTIFSESGKGGYIAKFDEMSWDDCKLEYCNIYNSGKIGSNNGKIEGQGILRLNPGFIQPNQLNFRLPPDVSLKLKSTDGKPMGISL